jgi:hypothetical protein
LLPQQYQTPISRISNLTSFSALWDSFRERERERERESGRRSFQRGRERERERERWKGGRMKIQCNVCEAAEAAVLCCADEAALCWECDKKIHAANKLASMHQRVPLSSSSSQMPKCDICQVYICISK